MVNSKKRKNRSEASGKKLCVKKDTKKAKSESTIKRKKQKHLDEHIKDHDSSVDSQSSSSSEDDENDIILNNPEFDSMNDQKNIQPKEKNVTYDDQSSSSSSSDHRPSFLLIPLLDDYDLDLGEYINQEINMEDAYDYPIGSGLHKKRNRLRLKTSRAKSPTSLRLEKVQKDIDDYMKEHFNDRKYTLKDKVLLLDIDLAVKANILRKMEDYEKNKSSYDQNKFNNWINDVLQLPFNKRIPLPISVDEGQERINCYLNKVRDSLEKAIAGQNHVKEEIIDYMARLISNPNSRGSILALTGPPGSGKTRLVRRGIADALSCPFHVINLGGMNDVHVLTGHDLTYTGAKYGRLAQILIQSQCENPVIYLDELDKIQSSHDKGMEIFRVLTHVLDEEQNHEFLDEYFSGVKINLSKVLFIGSLNNPDDIDPILRDRLKLIKMDNLDMDTKVKITKEYMIPELCDHVAMSPDTLQVSDDVIRYIISKKVVREDGCRQLKKKWETLIQKLNTMRITGTGQFEHLKDQSSDAIIAITITEALVDSLLKNDDIGINKEIFFSMYN